MLFKNGLRASGFIASLTIVALFGLNSAKAQTAKVIKVQGKKAIVQFPDDARPRVGQTIDLGGGGAVSMGGSSSSHSGSGGSRAMIVGGSTEFSSLTVSGDSTSSTRFAVDARYGWNKDVMEYGAVGGMTYYSTPGLSRRKLEAGGFFDYNLVPNTPGTEIVYGGAAGLKFGQLSSTTGSTEASGTIMTFEIGGQAKWFPLGNSVAIRADILYRLESVGDSVKALSTGSGLLAKAGFYIYF